MSSSPPGRPSFEDTACSEDTLLEHDVSFKDSPSLERERDFEEVSLEKGGNQKPRKLPFYKAIFTPAILIHLSIISLYTFFFFFALLTKLPHREYRGPELIYSPARSALKFEKKMFHGALDTKSDFLGPPGPLVDRAWGRLLQYTAIWVTGDTMEKIGKKTKSAVELKDGRGYFATLDVHHQLHCLYYVYRSVHSDHYNITEPNKAQHVGHCMDVIRQHIMCHADVAVNTYEWIPNYPKPWPNFETMHECANWDSIQDWAQKRVFDGFDPKLIQHPNYNPDLPSPFDYPAAH